MPSNGDAGASGEHLSLICVVKLNQLTRSDGKDYCASNISDFNEPSTSSFPHKLLCCDVGGSTHKPKYGTTMLHSSSVLYEARLESVDPQNTADSGWILSLYCIPIHFGVLYGNQIWLAGESPI